MTFSQNLDFVNVPGRAFPREKALSLTGVSSFKRGRVQVFSDTHLAIPISEHHIAVPEDDHLYRYLLKINKEIECAADPSSFEVLVFNGDTFEITGSCASYGDGHLPYLADGSLYKPELTRTVISEILNSNDKVIGELKRFLASSPKHKIVFVKGNHDAFLGMDEETQKNDQESVDRC